MFVNGIDEKQDVCRGGSLSTDCCKCVSEVLICPLQLEASFLRTTRLGPMACRLHFRTVYSEHTPSKLSMLLQNAPKGSHKTVPRQIFVQTAIHDRRRKSREHHTPLGDSLRANVLFCGHALRISLLSTCRFMLALDLEDRTAWCS